MKVYDNVLGLIGGTPLVRLSKLSGRPPVTLLGKVESLNPGGSVKDRGDAPKPYLVEGIGEDFIPATFSRQVVDEFVRASAAAALKYAQRVAPGTVMVVILTDSGRNYLTKIYSDQWMAEHGFLDPPPEHVTAGDVLRGKDGSPLITAVGPEDRASDAVRLLERHGFSQLPVLEDGRVVGSLHEVTFARLLSNRAELAELAVRDIMGRPLPQVDEGTDIAEPYRLLLGGHTGVVVTQSGRAYGLLSRIDLVHFWAGRVNAPQRGATVPSPSSPSESAAS